MKKYMAAILVLTIVLAGCIGTQEKQTLTKEEGAGQKIEIPVEVKSEEHPSEMPQESQKVEKPPERLLIRSSYKQVVDAVFFEKGNLWFEHFWAGVSRNGDFKNDESEMIVVNGNSEKVEITNSKMTYFVGSKEYNAFSGTWEKFPSERSWERMEYINIGQGYSGQPLILEPGQKGKLHYHYPFERDITKDQNQKVQIKITFKVSGVAENIEKELKRPQEDIIYTPASQQSEEEHGQETTNRQVAGY